MRFNTATHTILALRLLLAVALLGFGAISCGSDEPAPITEAPAGLAAELFGTPTIGAGSTMGAVIQGLDQDDVLTVTQSPEGVDTTIIGRHPDRRIEVKVPSDMQPGVYGVEFLLVSSDGPQAIRWNITIN